MQEKQEQRRHAEQLQNQGHQQHNSSAVTQPTGQVSQSPSTGSAATAAPACEPAMPSASTSANVSGDTSAILTDADVDKLNVDVMSEDFRKQLPMTLPDDTQLQPQHQQLSQPQQLPVPYDHM
jgi:hypothetical protein